jgi:hypothetical protein
MIRITSLDRIESAPRWIVAFLCVYSLVQLLVAYICSAASQVFSMDASSTGTSTLLVTCMASAALWLYLVVLRTFPKGSPLRAAWVPLTLAAVASVGSGVLAEILGASWLLNPLTWTGRDRSVLIDQIRQVAQLCGGPVRLAILALAMHAALRVFRRFGFSARPTITDWAMSGMICLFALCRFVEAGWACLAGRQVSLETWISLAGLPILFVLFLQAMLLRQAAARMGNGMVPRVWQSLVWSILLMGAGEVALWVLSKYSQLLPLGMLDSLIRLAIAAAFALTPAFQVSAQRRASQQSDSPAVELPAARIPLLAP